jgi:hypothetical protein
VSSQIQDFAESPLRWRSGDCSLVETSYIPRVMRRRGVYRLGHFHWAVLGRGRDTLNWGSAALHVRARVSQ